MAHMTATLHSGPSLNSAQSARTRALWLPREHGAWGMLLMPLATGAAVGVGRAANYVALLVFTIAALSLFWLRTPVEALVGTSVIRVRDAKERRVALTTIAIILAIAFVALTALFRGFRNFGLLAIGSAAALAFGLQSVLKKRGRSYRAISQVIGSIGLTSTAASAYYVVTGRFDSIALTLWVVNWLFAGEQIEFVQMRIRGARLENVHDRLSHGTSYLATVSAIGITIILLSLTGILPSLTIFAFVPAEVRSLIWFTSKSSSLDVHQLGSLELANAFVFAFVLIVIFRVG